MQISFDLSLQANNEKVLAPYHPALNDSTYEYLKAASYNLYTGYFSYMRPSPDQVSYIAGHSFRP